MQQLDKLYEELIQENTKKVDVLASLSASKFISDENRNYIAIRDGKVKENDYNNYSFSDLQDRVMEISPHALQQLCSKLGVPSAYINKCDPELRERNMRYWMSKSADNNLFRCNIGSDSSRVRGILSEKYAIVDDSVVISGLNDAIDKSNLDNPAITKMYTGDDMLRIQVVDGKKPVVNDTVMSFFAGNSEVGLSKIYVEMGLYTYRCTNGLRVPNFAFEFNRKHIGNITHNMISDNFQTSILGIIKNYSNIIQYMEVANQIILKRHMFSKYIEDAKNFSVSFKDNMKSRIKQLPAENILWHYISQITEEAHNYKESERMEIEKQAGLYMDDIIRKEVKKGKFELATI